VVLVPLVRCCSTAGGGRMGRHAASRRLRLLAAASQMQPDGGTALPAHTGACAAFHRAASEPLGDERDGRFRSGPCGRHLRSGHRTNRTAAFRATLTGRASVTDGQPIYCPSVSVKTSGCSRSKPSRITVSFVSEYKTMTATADTGKRAASDLPLSVRTPDHAGRLRGLPRRTQCWEPSCAAIEGYLLGGQGSFGV